MSVPTPDNPDAARGGLLRRILSMSGRSRLLITTGVLLALVVVVFDGCSGVEIDEDTAVATARTALENSPESFVPDHVDVRMIRQGFPPQARWAVVLVIRDPEGERSSYLRRAAITVDARTGEVLEVDIAGSG